MIKITRTMNNSLIVGETKQTAKNTTIKEPFAMIPMQEGIRMLPFDIELTGKRMEDITLSNDKIMYSVEPSSVIIDEYQKLLNGEETELEIKEPDVETETTEPTE